MNKGNIDSKNKLILHYFNKILNIIEKDYNNYQFNK